MAIHDRIVREKGRFDFQEAAIVEETPHRFQQLGPAAEHVERSSRKVSRARR